VTSYVTRLSSLWKWAIERGYADINPMRGLGIGNRPETKRRGFKAAELQQIFDALKDEREANSWKFWLPAIAAFNGARMGEILALKTTDFREEGGRFYFQLSEFDATGRRDDSKSLKTAQSERRLVPHLDLIDAGLAEFVQSAPAGHLFPEMTSSDASEWFARHLTSLGLKHPNTTFHSLRHGFRTACRKSGIDKEYVLALGGWAGLDVSDGYGDSQEVEVLAREIDKLKLGFRLGPAPSQKARS
jgi:integrase